MAGAALSAQEREKIRVGCAGGETFTAIAIELGVVLESTLESCSHLALGLDHGVAAHARSLGHCRLPATSQCTCHCAGHHPSLHLVQAGQHCREESRESLTTGLHSCRVDRAY